MGAASLQPAAARAVCTRTPLQLRAPLQLPAHRLAVGLRRSASLPPRSTASVRTRVRAGSLPDDVLADVQRPVNEQARKYAPHELLRAALQLSDVAHRGAAHQLHVRSAPLAILLLQGNAPHWPSGAWRYFEHAGRRDLVMHAAWHHDDEPQLYEAAAARRRLLRLLDAAEAVAPSILRGKTGHKKPLSKQRVIERVGALAAFAMHVPDEAWAQPPETWTPPAAQRCAHARCTAGTTHIRRCSSDLSCHDCIVPFSVRPPTAWSSSCAPSWTTLLARAFQCRPCCTNRSRRGTRTA
jgi:hypothetical protein